MDCSPLRVSSTTHPDAAADVGGVSQATDIEMAFALDAEDVESFMGSAEFSCVASGLIQVLTQSAAPSAASSAVTASSDTRSADDWCCSQGGVAKSYFSIKLADIPEFSCAGNEDKRVLVETLHNTNAMQVKYPASCLHHYRSCHNYCLHVLAA